MFPRKPDWFDRAEYYAIRLAALIVLIAALVRLIRGDLGW
jgi:hypothetical protein